jgi:hypothetical protein
MKLMSSHLSSIKTCSITVVMLLGMMLNSCKKESISASPTNGGTIRFASNAYTIENNTIDPLTIVLPLSLPLEQDATVLISVDNSSTISSSEYTVTPAIPATGITLSLPKGSTEVSFKVSSLNNFEGEKSLILKLSAATGGLTVANTNAMATINVKGNPIILPEIKTSTSSLAFGNVVTTTTSTSQSYTVTSIKLTADLAITASANFQVSLDNVAFTNTVSIPFATANATPITVYARFRALTGINQTVPGTITHSSGTLPDNTMTVSGVEYGVAPPGVLIMKEDFNYGTTANTLTAVSGGAWPVFSGTLNPVKYLATGLSFTGYAGSGIGGAVVSENGTGSREDYSKAFTTQTSGVIYAAQLVNVSAANATVDFFGGLRDPAIAGNYYNRLNVKDDGTGKPTFGIGKSSATVAFATGTYSYGTTYLVISKYDFSTGVSSLYVLTGAPSVIEPPVADATTSTGTGPAALGNIMIRQNTGVLTATYDGIRIATSWKEAVGL